MIHSHLVDCQAFLLACCPCCPYPHLQGICWGYSWEEGSTPPPISAALNPPHQTTNTQMGLKWNQK